MELRVLGSAGTAPRPGNPGSGYLVSAGDTRVLLDAGPGVAAALMDVVEPARLDAIFLSHRHPDHCSDIFALFHYLAYEIAPSPTIPVFAPGGLRDAATAFIGAAGNHPWFEVFEWADVDREVSVGEVTLTFAAASHSVPAAGVRVSSGAASLVYTGDTGPAPGLERLAQGAGTLLCEATYQDATDDGYPYHLAASMAGSLATTAGVERLVLTHLRSSLDPTQSVAEASATFDGEVLLAIPGMTIEI